MGDRTVFDRIAAWEQAGIIDGAVAGRLRAAEEGIAPAVPGAAEAHPAQGVVAAMFGPAVTIAEMFGYLGGIFLLAAWYAAVGRIAGTQVDPNVAFLIGGAIAATALAILGIRLTAGSRSQRRAAGALFVVAAANVGGAAWAVGQLAFHAGAPVIQVVASAAALVAALAFRRIHPSVLTQFALLSGVATLSGALLDALNRVVFPVSDFDGIPVGGPDPLLRVLLGATWWALTAVVLGLIALGEAATGTPAADRRAAVSRFAAGLTAVLGIAASLFPAAFRADGSYGRLLEPGVADAILLIVAALLIERAFRREAASYIYPAGLGVIIALTDINSSYLAPASSTEVGLFVEGAILLAAGVAFDRLRRRVSGGDARTGREDAAREDAVVVAAPERDAGESSASG